MNKYSQKKQLAEHITQTERTESVPEICNGKSDEVPIRVERDPDVGGNTESHQKSSCLFLLQGLQPGNTNFG